MVKKIQKHGNSYAVPLDRSTMDALNITPDDLVQIRVSNGSLIVTPTKVGFADEQISSTIARLRPRYKKMLENLAE